MKDGQVLTATNRRVPTSTFAVDMAIASGLTCAHAVKDGLVHLVKALTAVSRAIAAAMVNASHRMFAPAQWASRAQNVRNVCRTIDKLVEAVLNVQTA